MIYGFLVIGGGIAGASADMIGMITGARTIGIVPKRRTAILINAPTGLNRAALPAIDFAGTDAYLKPDAGKLMASPGDATPTEPHDAWPDDMDIAVFADWIERETTIKVERIEHSWARLRSFVPDEAPVLAKLTADLCTVTPTAHTTQFAHVLSPERLGVTDG